MTYEEERERALEQDAMTDGEYHAAALSQYADAHGADHPERAWILTPFDTWERNPHYVGPAQRHPEDDHDDDEDRVVSRALEDRSPGEHWADRIPGDPSFYLHMMDSDGEVHVDEGVPYATARECMVAWHAREDARADAFMPY